MANEVLTAMREAVDDLRQAVNELRFKSPVTHVYNPLEYAAAGHDCYLSRFATSTKRVVFLGMNPGPFGMAQVGVPFGAIPAVKEWMSIECPVGRPAKEHPKRPVTGFACNKVEVSGRRLWLELFARQFPRAEDFFRDHLVLNYCPLVFMTETGANFTPDKLKVSERLQLEAVCDQHLRRALDILQPEWTIGIGTYAEANLRRIAPSLANPPRIDRIIHPAPASPVANREWPQNPRSKLIELGIWTEKDPTPAV